MSNQIILGHALQVLRSLESESIDCIITSPPYWGGLREYGTNPQIWGGNHECNHEFPNSQAVGGEFCIHCNAWCGELGHEPSLNLFVEHIVELFREARRVLKPTGTFWLNLGDTYASAWAVSRRNVVGSGSLENGKRNARPNRLVDGLKEKDLALIPHRCAIALQDDGWYLRQELVWHKPNNMPEPVRDRCTRSHEFIFMFTKKPKKYFYDKDAISEPCSMNRWGGDKMVPNGKESPRGLHRERSVFGNGMRNKRSVWKISTRGFKGAHFATFPIELPEICVKAGCPEGGIVLDPFMGSGSTAIAALKNSRNYLGIELNPTYKTMAENRIDQFLKEAHS